MHWTTHLIAGAACGYAVGRPFPAVVLGVGMHLALDMAPHWDPEEDIGFVIDSFLGATLFTALASSKRVRSNADGKAAIWGAVGGGLPDVELLRRLFVYVKNEDYLFPAHNGKLPHMQCGVFESYALQAIVVMASLSLVAATRRRRTRGSAGSGEPSG